MPGRLFVKTFGCQMNEYDSARMADVLRAAEGLEPTDDAEAADVLLVNTCSVREKAQEKVFSLLGEWRRIKQRRPHVIIGVGGCVASQEGDGITSRAPFVDLVFGPQTLHRLPEMLGELRRDGRPVVDVSFPEIEKFDSLPEPRAEGATAYVSIMEGCSRYCTFCVVPYTRGEEISRSVDQVLAEVTALAEQGVREVTLLGQNVNAYSVQCPTAVKWTWRRSSITSRRSTASSASGSPRRTRPSSTPASSRPTPTCRSWPHICTCQCSQALTGSLRR
jgi:tRNA-2-methylthio-N6-dimethylallyladenosine synthase